MTDKWVQVILNHVLPDGRVQQELVDVLEGIYVYLSTNAGAETPVLVVRNVDGQDIAWFASWDRAAIVKNVEM